MNDGENKYQLGDLTGWQARLLRHICAPSASLLWRTLNMGHLGAVFLLVVGLSFHVWGMIWKEKAASACVCKMNRFVVFGAREERLLLWMKSAYSAWSVTHDVFTLLLLLNHRQTGLQEAVAFYVRVIVCARVCQQKTIKTTLYYGMFAQSQSVRAEWIIMMHLHETNWYESLSHCDWFNVIYFFFALFGKFTCCRLIFAG